MEPCRFIMFALVVGPLVVGLLPGCSPWLDRSALGTGLSLPEPAPPAEIRTERDGEQNEKGDPARITRLAADIEARGEHATALILYEQAAQADGAAASWIRFGDACLRAGQTVKAAEAYRAAIGRESANGQALMGLGVALAKQGEFEGALAYLQKAAPLVNTAEAYDRLGVVYTLSGHPHEAIAAIEEARRRAPGDLDVAANLALAAALAGQEQRAVAIMRETAASPQADDRHRRNFVLVLGLAGRAEEARRAAPQGASQKEIEELLTRANAVRSLRDGRARARALGMQRIPPSGRAAPSGEARGLQDLSDRRS